MALNLYLHYPFCNQICSYCDYCKLQFSPDLEKKYFTALTEELNLYRRETNIDIKLDTIHVGGGTPSTANEKFLGDFIEQIKKSFKLARNNEFSIEVNVEDITPEKLSFFNAIGINRIVLGVQTFDKRSLKLLNRNHTPHDIHKAVYLANVFDFENVAVDFLFGLPYQTSKKVSADLDQLIALEPKHISVYRMILEPETSLFGKIESKKTHLDDENLMFAFYKSIYEKLSETGYRRYSVTTFAKENFRCRHLMNIWQGQNYLGLGLGASSFIDNIRYYNTENIDEYIEQMQRQQFAHEIDTDNIKVIARDVLASSIQTADGIDRRFIKRMFGLTIGQLVNKEQCDIFIESGHLIADKGKLYLSEDGLMQAETIIARLLG